MRWLAALVGALGAALVHAAVPADAQCIAPAKPGGGFDLTCQLARAALREAGVSKQDLRVVYLPGGIGALAFQQAATQQPPDPRALVAFSSGSLLNLAQGRFGRHDERDVRWIAAIGMDHGVIAVHRDAPWTTLGQLLAALKAHPHGIVFGAGGTIGSQDWLKAALLARAAGISHKQLRFVAFEGGGEALAALAGRHVQVLPGDAAEVRQQIEAGLPVRVLAVLSQRRLPGRHASWPTAREQGHEILWPIVRGVYVGPRVGDDVAREWTDAFERAMAHPGFEAMREKAGLQPATLTGAPLQEFIARQMADYRRLAREFGLDRR
jgi:putative tricarboxylic transport membrane protein